MVQKAALLHAKLLQILQEVKVSRVKVSRVKMSRVKVSRMKMSRVKTQSTLYPDL
jgi:hypothetical protein